MSIDTGEKIAQRLSRQQKDAAASAERLSAIIEDVALQAEQALDHDTASDVHIDALREILRMIRGPGAADA